jgi:hypothetical protein
MIVILTEEPSMRAALETLFAKHWPARARGVDWMVISHEGKADLERKMEEKMRCWNVSVLKSTPYLSAIDRLFSPACPNPVPHAEDA